MLPVTRPKIPRIKGLQKSGFMTSGEALRLKQQPRVLTFLGGGYITCELAHFYGSLGTKINIIQLEDTLIPKEDKEISQKFTEIFSKKYNLYLGYETESIIKKNTHIGKNDDRNNSKNNSSDTFHIIAKSKSSGKILEIDSNQLIVAVGRIPNSDILGVEKTNMRLDENGFILVDAIS